MPIEVVSAMAEQLIKIQKELEITKDIIKEQKCLMVVSSYCMETINEFKKAIELREMAQLQEKKIEEKEKKNTELQFFIKYKLDKVYEEIKEEKNQISMNMSNVFS